MSTQTAINECKEFKEAVMSGNNALAKSKLNTLKALLLDFDSLPPLGMNSPNADIERTTAREVYEYAVILSINLCDKDSFQRNISSLKTYYNSIHTSLNQDVNLKNTILGLNLLFLLVENRLSDFHCELELLTESELKNPAISFCTQLDQHLMVGSYDQVMNAASNPPVPYYNFFLKSLLETVRMNIGECAGTSYDSLSVSAATKILMFTSEMETLHFISDNYPEWNVEMGIINFIPSKSTKSDGIPSIKVICQNLSYATELERIV